MKKEMLFYKSGYRVCNGGSVVSKTGNKMDGSVSGSGYLVISLRAGDSVLKCPIHRLQAFQKYGMNLYKKRIEVRHLNGNKLDNSWMNIEIGDHSQNLMDAPEHIRIHKAMHAASFIRKYDRDSVIDFYNKCGRSYAKTMDEFNISSKGTLHFILNGKKYTRE